MDIIRNKKEILPGEEIVINVIMRDKLTGSSLLRPVGIDFKILTKDGENSNDIFYNQIINATSGEASFSWKIPEDFTPGMFSVKITINNDFYEGDLFLKDGLTVENPSNWRSLLIFSIILMILSIFMIIKRKIQACKHSLRGMLIMHEGGVPIARLISPYFSKIDPTILSGAVSGMLTIVSEMTGHQLKTIEIEGGFLNLYHEKKFWLVLFLRKNPKWIQRTIKSCYRQIQKDWGSEIERFRGEILDLSINKYALRFFNVKIKESSETIGEEKSEKILTQEH